MFVLTLQVLGITEGLDVPNLVKWSIIPPAGGGQISTAGSMHNDEDGSSQHPHPAEPEDDQESPAGPHPAERTEPEPNY